MGRVIRNFMIIAALLLAVAACSSDKPKTHHSSNGEVELTISASRPMAEESRTAHVDGGVVWSEGDRILSAAYHSSGVWGDFYRSEEAQLADGGATATFLTKMSLPSLNDGEYTFYAGYPDSQFNGGEAAPTSNGEVTAVLPTEQKMSSAGSFDKSADLLVGSSIGSYDSISEQMNIPFSYTRLVAHGCLTLRSLQAVESEEVVKVTLTAPSDVCLTGSGRASLTQKSLSELDDNRVIITPAERTLATEDFNIWFCTAPATIAEGRDLNIKVATTRGSYERTITARATGINFYRNKYNTLGVDMSSARFSANECSHTVISSEQGYSNGENVGSIVGECFTITFNQGTGSTPTRYYNSGSSIRCYGGNTITVSSSLTIVKIEFVFGTSDNSNSMKSDVGSYSSGVWQGESSSVKFTIGGTSGHRKIERMIITCRGGESGDSGDDDEVLPSQTKPQLSDLESSVSGATAWAGCVVTNPESIADGKVTFHFRATDNSHSTSSSVEVGSQTYAQVQGVLLQAGKSYEVYASCLAADGEEQLSGSVMVATGSSLPSESWLELPAYTESDTALELKVLSSGERNYTAFYDKSTYTSLWVAYPLASRYMGSYSRPNGWSYNPLLSTSYQVNLCNRSYNDNYSRGHLIPNASRNGIRDMQLQTFYVTNSVPQIQDNFNGGIWQKLEAALQDEAQSGTLYIVTGVAFKKSGESKSISYTSAKEDSKRIPVPNYFYKVALKVKTNSQGVVTSASTIGFWFDHKTYTDSYTNHTATVDQIEQWTGFDFFANLPDNIEAAVESNSNWSSFSAF